MTRHRNMGGSVAKTDEMRCGGRGCVRLRGEGGSKRQRKKWEREGCESAAAVCADRE
jgi:hypothetical protein